MEQQLMEKSRATSGLVSVSEDASRVGGMTASDFLIPRAVILHEYDAERALKPGTMVNNVSGEVIAGTITPLFHYNSYVKFANSKAEFVTLNRLDPRVVRGLKWNDDAAEMKDKKPEVTQVMNFLCVVNDDISMPVIISFKSSAIKAGRRFLTTLVAQCGTTLVPGTGFTGFVKKHRYQLKIDENKGGLKTYWTPNFSKPVDANIFNVNADLSADLDNLTVPFARAVSAHNNVDAYNAEAEVEAVAL